MESLIQGVSLRISPQLLPLLSHLPLRPTSAKLPTSPFGFPSLQSGTGNGIPNLSPSDVGGSTPTEEETLVEALKVPDSWLLPSRALQESEWLRETLQKWLDDEYCPEPSNVEISEVTARSYHESLLAKKTDLGEILLDMIEALKTVSFQESFHGVFSSANAAVHLITLRMNSSSSSEEDDH